MRFLTVISLFLIALSAPAQDYAIPPGGMPERNAVAMRSDAICLDVRFDIPQSTTQHRKQIDSLIALTVEVYAAIGVTITPHIKYWEEKTPWRDTWADTDIHLYRYTETMRDTMPDGDYYDAYQLITVNGHGLGFGWLWGVGRGIQEKRGEMMNYRTSAVGFRPEKPDIMSKTMAHELGHNFGSPHTHQCYWRGNYEALDGCRAPRPWWEYVDTAWVEYACDFGPRPEYGTIMSYCHRTDVIDSLAFHPEVADTIRTYLRSVLPECDLVTASQQPIPQKVKIYPNPTTNSLTIEPEPDGVRIYSVSGAYMGATIDILPPGVYLVRVRHKNTVTNAKIIKL